MEGRIPRNDRAAVIPSLSFSEKFGANRILHDVPNGILKDATFAFILETAVETLNQPQRSQRAQRKKGSVVRSLFIQWVNSHPLNGYPNSSCFAISALFAVK